MLLFSVSFCWVECGCKCTTFYVLILPDDLLFSNEDMVKISVLSKAGWFHLCEVIDDGMLLQKVECI